MADLPHRHHGNFPQRQATLLPRVAQCMLELEAIPPETGPNLATQELLELSRSGICEMGKETKTISSPEKRKRLPDKSVKDLLKRIRIHPEAQRILGNSCIAVVSLERLNFQSVFLSSLQPVVSLVRLPCQTQAEPHSDQQNGFSLNEGDVLEIREGSPECKPAESTDLGQTETTSWTEPFCPDTSSPSPEPEQDSGFDCESNPDQTYILFDSGSEDGKSETFYLDPDAEQTLLIELDPDGEQGRCLQLEDESETKCEAAVSEVEDGEDQRADLCCSEEQTDCCIQQPEAEAATAETEESEDFCAVCLNGGDLLCCDRCPKVYHLVCHIPPLNSLPVGDWVCTLCRTDQDHVEVYDCENMHSCGGLKAPYTLSNQDQRRCEKLALVLYCNLLSAPFHEPVSPLARNYYQIIKRPIDLSVIRRKLDKSNTLHYFTAEQFVDDVLLMFKNCATFNYPDSEVAQAGRNLEVFFLSKLKEVFPDRTFPSANQDRTDRARLQWLSRKTKENYKKKRYMFSGKKYYL